jgi:CBS domain-containing protein
LKFIILFFTLLILKLGSVMNIEDLMIRSVITIPADTSVYEALKMLNMNGISCLIVEDNSLIVGIVTGRDFLERVLEKCRNPKETKISEIMTRRVVTGKPDMELSEATKLMFKKKVKKLPIVDGNRLVGMVTLTDIARATSMNKKTTVLLDQLSNMHAL